MCNQCFHTSCTWLLPDGKSSVCVSANSSLPLTTHPPRVSAHSPLFQTLKAKLSLTSFSLLPSSLCSCHPFSLLSVVCPLSPAVSRKSVQNLFNSPWFSMCTRADVEMCACAYVHAGRCEHETDVWIMKVRAERGHMTPSSDLFQGSRL